MNQEKLYQINLPPARFAIGVGILEFLGEPEWVVQQTDPEACWMIGITIEDIKLWVQQHGGRIEEMQDSQARIAEKTKD